MTDRYRRPGTKWCTDTAIRLLQIASRELGREPQLLGPEDAQTLLAAAVILDAYGQRIGQARSDEHSAQT